MMDLIMACQNRQHPYLIRNTISLLIIPIILFFISCDVSDDTPRDTSSAEDDWLIPRFEIRDGGPGQDGIPSIDNPDFDPVGAINFIPDNRMIIGVKFEDEIRAYPHQILDWHEIVNDQVGNKSFAIQYCPLTGTGMCWNREIDGSVTEFGVSGLLFRNNLIAYDRNTESNWSQMQLRSVHGQHSGLNVETYPVVETTWETWKKLYPNSKVHNTNTGHVRNYTSFAYGSGYSTNHNDLLFPIQNHDDRLRNKVRVHGIIGSENLDLDPTVKVYVINDFGDGVNLIEDSIDGNDYVIIGSGEYNFAAAFLLETTSENSTQFSAVQEQLPVVMQDNEGNSWDIFGYAVEGPRQGERLTAARSYTGYWFAWADFFPGLEIYENMED
jgi:hypothetical protein